MSDPTTGLFALFGDRAREFASGTLPREHILVHDRMDRFPEAMRTGDLSTFDRLCAVYKGPLETAGGEGKKFRQSQISGPPPPALLCMGLTAYFFDVLSSVPHLRGWRTQIATELGIPAGRIRCAAWASPDGAGLPPHFDRYDGIILQVQGEKTYLIGPNAHVRNTVRGWNPNVPLDVLDIVQYGEDIQTDVRPENLQEVVLKPGSVLFLPRGYWHGTQARGESFSASIRLDPPIAADIVLAQLRLAMLADPEWRRPMYGAWGDETAQRAAREVIDERIQSLPRALSRVSAQNALVTAESIGDQFKHVSAETRFCRDHTKVVSIQKELEEGHTRASLHDLWTDRTTEFATSAETKDALSWIVESPRAFRAADVGERFPKIPQAEVRLLLEALTRLGVLRLMPW